MEFAEKLKKTCDTVNKIKELNINCLNTLNNSQITFLYDIYDDVMDRNFVENLVKSDYFLTQNKKIIEQKINELRYKKFENEFKNQLKNYSVNKKELIFNIIKSDVTEELFYNISHKMSVEWLKLILYESKFFLEKKLTLNRCIIGLYNARTSLQKKYENEQLKKYEIDENDYSKFVFDKLKQIIKQDKYSDKEIKKATDFFKKNDNKIVLNERECFSLFEKEISFEDISFFDKLQFRKYNLSIESIIEIITNPEIKLMQNYDEIIDNYLSNYNEIISYLK